MMLLLPICTVIYLNLLVYMYVISPPVLEAELENMDAITVIITVVYVFCMLLIIASKESVIPDISQVLYKNIVIPKDKAIFLWNKDSISKKKKKSVWDMLDDDPDAGLYKIFTKLIYKDKQLNFDKNVLSWDKITEIKSNYPHLQIDLEYNDKQEIIVSTKSKYHFNDMVSAKYILKLVFSAQEASEKIVLACINEPHRGDDANSSNLDNPIQKY